MRVLGKLWVLIALVVVTSWAPSSARAVAETGQPRAQPAIGRRAARSVRNVRSGSHEGSVWPVLRALQSAQPDILACARSGGLRVLRFGLNAAWAAFAHDHRLQLIQLDEIVRLTAQFVGDHRWL